MRGSRQLWLCLVALFFAGCGSSGGGDTGGSAVGGGPQGSIPSGSGGDADPARGVFGTGSQPALAVQRSGSAVVVFESGGQILGCWYRPGSGWCSALDVVDSRTSSAGALSAAVAPNGNAIAGWQRQEGGAMRMFASIYAPNQSQWLAWDPVDANDQPDLRYGPKVAISDSRAFAVLIQPQAYPHPGQNCLYVARSDDLGATDPTWVLQGGESQALCGIQMRDPQIAMDPQGNAGLSHLDNNDHIIDFHPYSDANGWTTIYTLMNHTDGSVNGPPALDRNDYGYSVVAWPSNVGGQWQIWSACITPGVGADTPVVTPGDTSGVSSHPQVQIYGSNTACGPALLVWEEDNGSLRFARRLAGDTGWQTAADVPTGGQARDPRLALNAQGVGFLLWRRENGGQNDLWMMRYDGSAWGSPVALEEGADNVVEYQVGVDDSGTGFAVWTQGGTVRATRLQ